MACIHGFKHFEIKLAVCRRSLIQASVAIGLGVDEVDGVDLVSGFRIRVRHFFAVGDVLGLRLRLQPPLSLDDSLLLQLHSAGLPFCDLIFIAGIVQNYSFADRLVLADNLLLESASLSAILDRILLLRWIRLSHCDWHFFRWQRPLEVRAD